MKKITKYEIIKHMSIEQMAKVFASAMELTAEVYCPAISPALSSNDNKAHELFLATCLEWLNEEV